MMKVVENSTANANITGNPVDIRESPTTHDEITRLGPVEKASKMPTPKQLRKTAGEPVLRSVDDSATAYGKVKPFRIYLKSSRQWVDVSEEYYRDHTRYYDAFRKRHQEHGRCICPKAKFWLCDGDCPNCDYRRAGDQLSLGYTVVDGDGDEVTLQDTLPDTSSSIEDVIADKAELDQLFARLSQLMPEAAQIGKLRQEGLSDAAIADIVGIKRTTFLSRLKKAKEQIAAEFPEHFE